MTLEGRLIAERAAFDAGFATPAKAKAEETVRLLTLRLGGERFALRIDELAGLHTGRRVVPLPARAPGLLGLVGIRGQLVPVFALSQLLGQPAGGETPCWLALAAGADPVALAFAVNDGYQELPRSAVRSAEREHPRAHVREVARLAAGSVAVISIPSILAGLAGAVPKEHR